MPLQAATDMARITSMRVLRGKVIDGQVVVEGGPLPEGSEVTVYADDADGGFHLDEGSIRELLEAQAEIRSGNYVRADEVVEDLDD